MTHWITDSSRAWMAKGQLPISNAEKFAERIRPLLDDATPVCDFKQVPARPFYTFGADGLMVSSHYLRAVVKNAQREGSWRLVSAVQLRHNGEDVEAPVLVYVAEDGELLGAVAPTRSES